jgi:chromosome segregation ATPase
VAGILGVGGAGARVAAGSDALPPGVSEAPAQLAELRGEVARLRERVGRCEADVDDARATTRRTDRRLEQAIGELEQLRRRVPTIQGVAR